jgi:hypothetical protein
VPSAPWRAGLSRQPYVRAGLADSRQTRAQRNLAGDEVSPTRRAACLDISRLQFERLGGIGRLASRQQ